LRKLLTALNDIKALQTPKARLLSKWGLTHQISALLGQFGSEATASDIKRLILEEDPLGHPSKYFSDMIALFNADASELDLLLPVIQDVWNYLPHRSLGGRCPAEVMTDIA